MKLRMNAVALLVSMLSTVASASHAAERVVATFDAKNAADGVELSNAKARSISRDNGRALELKCVKADTVGFSLRPDAETWDWTGMAGVAIDVYNPQGDPLKVFLATESRNDAGERLTARVGVPLPPREQTTVRLFFDNYGAGPYWGMRGIPVYGPLSLAGPKLSSFAVDRARVTEFKLYLLGLEKPCKLVVDNLRVFSDDSPLDALVPFPFIDAFGQYIHADWPGKVHDEAGLVTQRDNEARELGAAPVISGRDRFGGWADGPQREATGWFRTEQVDGKWWLVTPEGHLFFSVGVNCVRNSATTFVEGRDRWFAALPDPEGPFKDFYGFTGNTHSMAETIGGKGRNFDFYAANLYRKYGTDWRTRWLDITCKRLPAWGFNTLGNWSGDDVRAAGAVPFVVHLSSGSARRIEGGGGFWSKLFDVFDPSFEPTTGQSVANAAKTYADNPMCIGYFVDNELSWNGIADGTLNSPPDQPCRIAFVDDLKQQYGTVDKLNAAWETDAPDWDALRVPRAMTAKSNADCLAFETKFAQRYFATIAAALRKHAPNQLYLGCRFASGLRKPHILKACAENVDVVGINEYALDIRSDAWTGDQDLGKPIIIGEFHFGALDSGLFHQGLVSAKDQADRGVCYERYVRSVAECPAFVGCHWFQFSDEPTTGRTWDGENFNIGLVALTDRPYEEMLEHVKRINQDVYALHAGR